MTLRARRAHYLAGTFSLGALLLAGSALADGQVFVVGEKTATDDVKINFTPTNLQLPTTKLTERGRRELIRNLEDEQGFAHVALPMGPGLTLRANGPLTPGPEQYRKMIFDKGQSAAPGDRVAITAMTIKDDRIIFDLNGGPYAKHRFLSHVQFNDTNVVQNPGAQASGSRITLVFEGPLPEISAPEVKALLEPLIDFGVKTSDQAYADTLPAPLKEAIAAHDVLVGMTHRMVLAALGAPESKLRDQPSGDASGTRYEEWIYGHVPQTVRFVRFVGDRVAVVEIAALGKPIEVHDKNEMPGYVDHSNDHEVAMGDRKPASGDEGGEAAAPAPPTLRKPGEAVEQVPNAPGKVQYPDAKPIPAPPSDANSDPQSAGAGAGANADSSRPASADAPNTRSSGRGSSNPSFPDPSSPRLR